jgi:hypothetical protein
LSPSRRNSALSQPFDQRFLNAIHELRKIDGEVKKRRTGDAPMIERLYHRHHFIARRFLKMFQPYACVIYNTDFESGSKCARIKSIAEAPDGTNIDVSVVGEDPNTKSKQLIGLKFMNEPIQAPLSAVPRDKMNWGSCRVRKSERARAVRAVFTNSKSKARLRSACTMGMRNDCRRAKT